MTTAHEGEHHESWLRYGVGRKADSGTRRPGSTVTGTLLALSGTLTAAMVVALLALAGLPAFTIIIVSAMIVIGVVVAIAVGSVLRSSLARRGHASH